MVLLFPGTPHIQMMEPNLQYNSIERWGLCQVISSHGPHSLSLMDEVGAFYTLPKGVPSPQPFHHKRIQPESAINETEPSSHASLILDCPASRTIASSPFQFFIPPSLRCSVPASQRVHDICPTGDCRLLLRGTKLMGIKP